MVGIASCRHFLAIFTSCNRLPLHPSSSCMSVLKHCMFSCKHGKNVNPTRAEIVRTNISRTDSTHCVPTWVLFPFDKKCRTVSQTSLQISIHSVLYFMITRRITVKTDLDADLKRANDPHFPTGFHTGHVLPPVLARPKAYLWSRHRPWEIGGWRWIHPANLGARHLFRQWEKGLLSRCYHWQPVSQNPAHRSNSEKHPVCLLCRVHGFVMPEKGLTLMMHVRACYCFCMYYLPVVPFYPIAL